MSDLVRGPKSQVKRSFDEGSSDNRIEGVQHRWKNPSSSISVLWIL